MKIGSKLQYGVPDECPKDCRYIKDFSIHVQSSICVRCPVLNCKEDGKGLCLIDACDFRDDWSEQWVKFFSGEIDEPVLMFAHPEVDWNPKQYFSKDRHLEWGQDLTSEQMDALRKGEMFTLDDKEGNPCKLVLMDSYDTIRESQIGENVKVIKT